MANIVGVSTEPEQLRVENKYVFEAHFHCQNCSYRFAQSFLKGDVVIPVGQNARVHPSGGGTHITLKCKNCDSDSIKIEYRKVIGDNKE